MRIRVEDTWYIHQNLAAAALHCLDQTFCCTKENALWYSLVSLNQRRTFGLLLRLGFRRKRLVEELTKNQDRKSPQAVRSLQARHQVQVWELGIQIWNRIKQVSDMSKQGRKTKVLDQDHYITPLQTFQMSDWRWSQANLSHLPSITKCRSQIPNSFQIPARGAHFRSR